MLKPPAIASIYFYPDPVDMRKQINGISQIVATEKGHSPQSGDLYIFSNRTRDKIKCLLWHNNGFVILYKQFESGKLKFSRGLSGEISLTIEQFDALLMGFDFTSYHMESTGKFQYYA